MLNSLKISKRQEEILNFIKNTLDKRGFPPSIKEIGEAVGLASTSTVHLHLKSLEKKGLIIRNSRTLEILNKEEEVHYYPLYNNNSKNTLEIETFPLPLNFVETKTAFLLKIEDESLKEIGIFKGDLAIIKNQENAQNNDLIAAEINQKIILRRFFKNDNFITLKSENFLFKPMHLQEVKIKGKIIGIIRKI